MEAIEITKQGIVIIQWLRGPDPQLGEALYTTIRNKEAERENYFVEYDKVDSKGKFEAVLQEFAKNGIANLKLT